MLLFSMVRSSRVLNRSPLGCRKMETLHPISVVCCVCGLDVYRSEVTDTRVCRVDPTCLGVAETVLPLRRGGSGSTYAPFA